MRKKIIELEIYKFNELKEETQKDIICRYIKDLIETTNFEKLNKNSKLYKAYKRASENYTPWFLGNFILETCEKEIKKELNKNEYLETGEIYYE